MSRSYQIVVTLNQSTPLYNQKLRMAYNVKVLSNTGHPEPVNTLIQPEVKCLQCQVHTEVTHIL